MTKTKEQSSLTNSSNAPRKSFEVSRSEIEERQHEPQPEDDLILRKKGKDSKKATKKNSQSMTIDKCLDAFGKCLKKQTRWVDEEALERLGIKDDVRAILKNIGMESFLTMKHEAYDAITVQFLSSLEIDISDIKPKTIGNLGCIRWKAFWMDYDMSFKDLCGVYGFKPSTVTNYDSNKNADKELWKLIGHGEFDPSKTRSSMIKNPAVRYVHKKLMCGKTWRVLPIGRFCLLLKKLMCGSVENVKVDILKQICVGRFSSSSTSDSFCDLF